MEVLCGIGHSAERPERTVSVVRPISKAQCSQCRDCLGTNFTAIYLMLACAFACSCT